jgi:hypothetical protein
MTKTKFLKILNPVMAVDFICLAATALLDDVIPPEIYGRVHPVLGFFLVFCVLVHVVLNWAWIKSNFFGKKN